MSKTSKPIKAKQLIKLMPKVQTKAEQHKKWVCDAIKNLKELDPKYGFFLAIQTADVPRAIGLTDDKSFLALAACHLLFRVGRPDNPLASLFGR